MMSNEVPIQPLRTDAMGILRFLPNTLVQRLLDHCRNLPELYRLDLNRLACEQHSQGDREQFAMLLGYSLCGFGDLSYVSDETFARAEEVAAKPKVVVVEAKGDYGVWKSNYSDGRGAFPQGWYAAKNDRVGTALRGSYTAVFGSEQECRAWCDAENAKPITERA